MKIQQLLRSGFNLFLLFVCIFSFQNCVETVVGSEDNYQYSYNSKDRVDTIDFKYLKNKYPLDSIKLDGFDKEMKEFVKADLDKTPQKDGILFVGSSSIALWTNRIQKDMAPLPVINRGLSGSRLLQLLYYFPHLITVYQPRIVVLYCENDIEVDDVNVIFEKIRYFENQLHYSLPNTILFIVSIKPSNNRINFIDKMEKTNQVLLKYAEKRPNTHYIDVFNPMMIQGVVDETLFRADKLHLNDKGYDLWTSIIKLYLTDSYNK